VTDVGQAVPYTNHPPGLAWICALTGGSEAGLRLPALVALFASGWLLCELPLWTGLPGDRTRLRALLLPGTAMPLSALAILGWTTWARALPALQPGIAETAHSKEAWMYDLE
jgi:hypothetical protein